ARIARRVIALESDEELAGIASEQLSEIGAANASVVRGPLAAGHSAAAPYDVIVLEGSGELVPQALFDQLGEGGRLVAVIGSVCPAIANFHTKTEGDIGRRPAYNSNARSLPGFERPKSFVF